METAVLSVPSRRLAGDPIRPVEIAGLLALCLLAVVVRAWHFGALGLTHFDEGVYALTGRGLVDPTQGFRLFPSQPKFSPLVFPALLAGAFTLLGGPGDSAAFVVNIVLGSAMVVAVWAIGRHWFGPSAGLAAAALVALNDFHIILSRSVLTDVAFSLVFLLALAAATRACERQTVGSAVVAGLLVGIAWNTKYHGWLVVVIVAGAGMAHAILHRASMRSVWGLVRTVAVISVVAVLCYVPWVLYVNAQPGGYEALARYQKTMLSRRWLENFRHQAAMQWALDGVLTRVSIVTALFCAALVGGRRALSLRWLLVGAIATVAGIFSGGTAVCFVLALCTVPTIALSRPRLSSVVAAVWLLFWCFITPLYRPFARLVLPFTIAAVLLAAKALAPSSRDTERAEGGVPGMALAAAASAGLLLVAAALWSARTIVPPASPDIRKAVAGVAAIVPAGARVAVVAEPEAEFYLRLAHLTVDRFEESNAPPQAPYVVSGFYGKRSPRLRSRIAMLQERLVPMKTFHVVPAPMRLADDVSPSEMRAFESTPDGRFDFTLFRLLPEQAVQSRQ